LIVLDTNVVSELMKAAPHAKVGKWLNGLGGRPLATTVITLAEITYAICRLEPGRRRSSLEERFEELVDPRGGPAVLSVEG
jgi:predicted nucleic acid-binding protein